MRNVLKGETRGTTRTSWLTGKHSFSFGEYYDPSCMGYSVLRVINDDVVQPSSGFPMHGHKNMEIVTVVMSGALEHRDSLGNGAVIHPMEVQVMSAGKGILHSEFNPSSNDPVHLLQIWIQPEVSGGSPSYQQKQFSEAETLNRFCPVAAKGGKTGALPIGQDAVVSIGRFEKGASLTVPLDNNRRYWVQVGTGKVIINGEALSAGDALTLEKEAGTFTIEAEADSFAVLFDLP